VVIGEGEEAYLDGLHFGLIEVCLVFWLSVCLVCVSLRFVVDGGRKRGRGRRRVLKYPSKPLSLRPESCECAGLAFT